MTYTMFELNLRTRGQLLEIYNAHAEKPLLGFKDHATAVARTAAVLGLEEPVRPSAKNADPATIAARAAKWGFGTNVEAYLGSVAAQAEYRKAKSAGDAEWTKVAHAKFRELNRNKKEKYCS